jgi:uncharacterized membrane protein YcaP (DUF421 family)
MECFPTVLVRGGKRDPAALKSHSIPDAALDRGLHGAGIETDHDVETGQLERNGKITRVLRRA